MTMPMSPRNRFLEAIVDHIDIPKSYYERASARHHSLYEWLVREESSVAGFDPDVRPQGSFRYGTVIRPIFADDEYDLDNVCLLRGLNKSTLTQKQLKELYGNEIKAYAIAHNMNDPVTEHNRCWRLNYADEVNFHLDTLPCVQAETAVINSIRQVGVEQDLAQRAVAITDRKHPQYAEICSDWRTSNPRGFAAWFEVQASLGRGVTVNDGHLRASVEDVPPYEWKTTLQRSIQLLKRHRDVMFRDSRDLAPISMIITNLAARAYRGENDMYEALRNIVTLMPSFISSTSPRVPNPTHPAEDYADKWSRDPRLEKSFYDWYTAVSADIDNFQQWIDSGELSDFASERFDITLSKDEVRIITPNRRGNIVTPAIPASVSIPKAPRPWGRDGKRDR